MARTPQTIGFIKKSFHLKAGNQGIFFLWGKFSGCFSAKNVKKNWIFCGKSFEKSISLEIPKKITLKVIFRRKKLMENRDVTEAGCQPVTVERIS
jgi:hypothetical protein